MARLYLCDPLIEKFVVHGDLAHLNAQAVDLLVPDVAQALP